MLRDELISKLSATPDSADVVVTIGHYRIDITGVTYDAERDQIVFDFPADDVRFAVARFNRPTPPLPNERTGGQGCA